MSDQGPQLMLFMARTRTSYSVPLIRFSIRVFVAVSPACWREESKV